MKEATSTRKSHLSDIFYVSKKIKEKQESNTTYDHIGAIRKTRTMPAVCKQFNRFRERRSKFHKCFGYCVDIQKNGGGGKLCTFLEVYDQHPISTSEMLRDVFHQLCPMF